MNKIQKLWYSCKEISIPQLADYAIYLAQKKTGQLERSTSLGGLALDFNPQDIELKIPFEPFSPELLGLLEKDRERILRSADEVLSGWYHPFGGEKAPLTFSTEMHDSVHWSAVGDQVNGKDIKWLWEPARFSWAFDLAKAWLLSREDRYASFFWEKFAEFTRLNPVNSAPNFTSAQECAMRLLAWLVAYQVFETSPVTTAEHKAQLSAAIWQQAARIPPTLGYARSQNNNHLLSEALGLYVAGGLFSKVSRIAQGWKILGFETFNRGILKQVEADGTYSQHSANYHRLMLQLALLFNVYTKHYKAELPTEVMNHLAAATRWLGAQLDPQSGRLPNFGHNDGSLLLPMGTAEYRDYRPTLQCSSLAFLGQPCLPAGAWDELALWLGLPNSTQVNDSQTMSSPAVHVLSTSDKHALLRGVTFHGRPAHADQLHLDLWWDGFNIAQDAGTFSYNDAPPWQNPFSSTLVHNTVSVDHQDQMLKASKFLWLRQAQAKWQNAPSKDILMASHDGYRRAGMTLHRIATFVNPDLLEVIDQVHFIRPTSQHLVNLHWLLIDWQSQLNGSNLWLSSGERKVKVSITAHLQDAAETLGPNDVSLIRGGETLNGKSQAPLLGWASDTYGEKHPALSFSVQYHTQTDLQIVTRFEFSKNV